MRTESRRRSHAIRPVLFLALALTALAHGRALTVPFLWDDEHIFLRSNLGRVDRIWSSFRPSAWRDDRTGRYAPYRPLRDATYAVCALVFGVRPWPFHLLSLAFHALNIVLVFELARGLFRNDRAAVLAAVVFAALPAHVEAVTYAKNVSETQSLCLSLVSLLLAVRALRGARGWTTCAGLSVAAYAAALLAKESAWPLPLILAAWLVIARPRRAPGRARPPAGARAGRRTALFAPLLAVAVAYAALQLHLRAAGRSSRFVERTERLGVPARVELAGRTVLGYLGALAFPAWPRPWPSLAMPSGPSWGVVGGAALAAVLVGAAARRRPRAALAFGAWWAVLALAPAANLVAGNTARPMAGQRLYTPSVGYALLLGPLLAGWPAVGLGRRVQSRSRLRRLSRLGVLAVAAGVAASWWATGFWQDPLGFWRYVVRTGPGTYQAHYNLGLTYARSGVNELAVPAYLAALSLRRDDADSAYGLANALLTLGRAREAEPWYRRAILLDAERLGAYHGLGASLARQGRCAEAEQAFLKARKLDPSSLLAVLGLLKIYQQSGRHEAAVALARDAIRYRPRDPELHLALGRALARLGRRSEAVESLSRALEFGAGPQARPLLERLRSEAPGANP